MRSIRLAITGLLAVVMVVAFASAALAGKDDNFGNAMGIVDEAIGAIVKGIASVYVDLANIDSARAAALHYIGMVDDKTFAQYYSRAYHQAQKEIPAEIFGYAGIPGSMSRKQAMSEVSSLSKQRIKDIINSIPNAVMGACFRRFVHDKYQKDLSESSVRESASDYGQKIVDKINSRF